jgi:ribonucleoside-diphosphate reductase beta chain
MTSLLEHNPLIFKSGGGFDYPIFYDFYERAVGQVWRHQEVAMESDLRDWQQATDLEREIISGILKGFVTSELGIGCYWGEEVCDLFPKPEIRAMARTFSFYETIHAAAYSYLNDLLGLDEYEAFVSDPIAMKKVDAFFQKLNPKVSLAVFSAGGEGISLFASFAALLAFNLTGRFKGLAQIISWSTGRLKK